MRYSVIYERQDALCASSFFGDINEQERGIWRIVLGIFGILLFAMGLATKVTASSKGHLMIFIAAAAALSWSVDPAFREFTRRLWLRRGLALTADFSDTGITIESNSNGSRFTEWSDVTCVIERADGILLVFKTDATPYPGIHPWQRRLARIVGDPIVWLPTRAFVNDEAKSALFEFASRFANPRGSGLDPSFFRRHVATLLVMILVITASFVVPSESQIYEARYTKGIRYLNGDGVIRDDAKGVALITYAAGRDFAPAQDTLGLLYAEGSHGVSKTPASAQYWFSKAAAAGLADAQNNLGDFFEAERSYSWAGPQAAYWYRMAATQGYAPADNNLCRIYFYGFGVVRDEKQAAYWCQKAAEAGFGEAENILGGLYMTGAGVPQDNTQAEKWFRKADAQGFPQAKINLSVLLGETSTK
jgi:TPR repeat protein